MQTHAKFIHSNIKQIHCIDADIVENTRPYMVKYDVRVMVNTAT